MSSLVLDHFPQALGQFDPGATLSADGRLLAYATAAGGAGLSGIVIVNTATREVQTISAAPGINHNFAPAISGDGSVLAFVTMDPHGLQQLAAASLGDASLRTASSSATGVAGNAGSRAASLSADGRLVAFVSAASNLVADDTNELDDIFIKDLQTGAVTRIAAPGGAMATGAQLSADGRVLLFQAAGDTLAWYTCTLATGALAQVAGRAELAQVSADGRYLAYSSSEGVFRKDLASGALEQVATSASQSGLALSADGRVVVFGGASGTALNQEMFARDMGTGVLTQLSSGAQPGQSSFGAAISADGSHVAFATYAGTTADYTGLAWDMVMATLATPEVRQLTGTSGFDQLAYGGLLSEYAFASDGGTIKVTRADLGTVDALAGIERLQFADAMYALDSMGRDGVAGQAYRIYQAAFNRSPDAAGVGFWISAMDAGLSLESVAQGFVASAEFTAMYGGADGNGAIIDRLYQNVLHRAGEADGMAYWTDVLDRGAASLAQVLAAFSESDENVAALTGVLQHGFAYLPYG